MNLYKKLSFLMTSMIRQFKKLHIGIPIILIARSFETFGIQV